MNYNEIKVEINKHYEELAKENNFFPYIKKDQVTILKSGYYLKKNANYRGITYFFNDFRKDYICILAGYYFVPENCVVVYDGIEITDKRMELIKKYIGEGYKLINKMPSLPVIEFPAESKEYEVSKHLYELYNKNKKNDTFSNGKTPTLSVSEG